MAAAVQMSRMRSTRMTANLGSRPLSTASATNLRAQSQARSDSPITVPIVATPSFVGPSPLALFLTNLRLLDLDLLPDWPAISTETFVSSGAGVQGQKKRVHCVEWALFRLFSIWDPEETAGVCWNSNHPH